MNWDEWCKMYPARKVTEEPSLYDLKCQNYQEAEHVRDLMEGSHNSPFEVVQFQNFFYVIDKKETD